jgi:hypothetical protein
MYKNNLSFMYRKTYFVQGENEVELGKKKKKNLGIIFISYNPSSIYKNNLSFI